jgi:hypothetical protein
MLNIEFIKELNKKFIIDIDTEMCNLNNRSTISIFSQISIHNNDNDFFFKLIFKENNVVQLQCLSSFKILMIMEDKTIFFEEFLKINETKWTLFEIVYDEYSISLFPLHMPNTILCFNDKLFIKPLHTIFDKNDQTIFPFEPIINTNVILITNSLQTNLKTLKISNIKELFYTILTNYSNLQNSILISFGNTVFPVEFYIKQETWTYIDRKIENNECFHRNLMKQISLYDIDILPNDTEWVNGDKNTMLSLPKSSDLNLLWYRFVSEKTDIPKYFSSSNTYIISRDMVFKHAPEYYNKIYVLLDKVTDKKIEYLFQIALFSIFFVND